MPDASDEFQAEVLARGPTMFLEERGKESVQEALVAAVNAAGQAGQCAPQVGQLCEMILARLDGALTGQPPASVESLKVTLRTM